MLRRLHPRNEVHYVALADGPQAEAVRRSSEYCSYPYPIEHRAPARRSAGFLFQAIRGLYSSTPVAIERYRSPHMERQIEHLCRRHHFDCLVSDFLTPCANIPDLSRCVLFQHNVETVIWRRLAQHSANFASRFYLHLQAERMFAFERRICQGVRKVIAVSRSDAELMESLFDVKGVTHVPTGVDVDHFTPPAENAGKSDLLYLGSMDWMPNIDGVTYFVREVLPLIRRRRPDCTLTIAGRQPAPQVQALEKQDSRITVTGTVADVRPYLWDSKLSIVPLRIGGGTRLKIYESMAAKVPVVSTTIGAEGLEVTSPDNIRLADTPAAFAENCLEFLEDAQERERTAVSAWELVKTRFSWEEVTKRFEQALRC